MDYVKKFLHIDGIIGQGAFGRVLATSSLQNQSQQQQQQSPQQQQQSQQQVAHHQENQQMIFSSQLSPITQPCSNNFDKQLFESSNIATNFANLTTSTPPASKYNKHQQFHNQQQQQQPSFNSNGASPTSSRFALKCVHPILRPQRLASELRHLRDLGGHCNVVQMHSAHFCMGSLFIVMELIDHDRFVSIVGKLDLEEIVIYMKNLLIALEHVHAHNVMHRDIKPANFLFNRKTRKFLLVDFGLAQLVRPRSGLFPNSGSVPSTPNSLQSTVTPITPNISQKRTFPQLLNHQDFKKLRVSNVDIKEPVKLTVGAYESPVTDHHNPISGHNRSINRHRQSNLHQRNQNQSRHTPNGGGNTNLDGEGRFSTPKTPRRKPSGRCDCRGKPKICPVCSSRNESVAPKSGTPGFKAPEILLRYPHQTTAIDIWSAGVIFACLICGHSPFFRDVDDNMSLAEIITLLGSQKVVKAAEALGIRLLVEPKRDPVDLVEFCRNLRSNNPQEKRQIVIPDSGFDLLRKMLDPNPNTRITASAALKHPWFEQENNKDTMAHRISHGS